MFAPFRNTSTRNSVIGSKTLSKRQGLGCAGTGQSSAKSRRLAQVINRFLSVIYGGCLNSAFQSGTSTRCEVQGKHGDDDRGGGGKQPRRIDK